MKYNFSEEKMETFVQYIILLNQNKETNDFDRIILNSNNPAYYEQATDGIVSSNEIQRVLSSYKHFYGWLHVKRRSGERPGPRFSALDLMLLLRRALIEWYQNHLGYEDGGRYSPVKKSR